MIVFVYGMGPPIDLKGGDNEMGITPDEILEVIPVVNEAGDPDCDLSNKNQSFLVSKDGRLFRGEDNHSSMNLMKERFS